MKYIVFIGVWLGMLAIKIPTALLGPLTIAYMWRYKDRQFQDLPRWTKPWANPEDWRGGHMHFDNCLPKWWVQREGRGFRSFWKYHAIRNPANGLRTIEWLDLDIDPEKMAYKTPKLYDNYEPHVLRQHGKKSCWYWAWQGKRAGCKYVRVWNKERHLVFKFGWRIEPQDKYKPIDPNGVRVKGAGFASKFLPYRKG